VQKKKASLARKIITLSVPQDTLLQSIKHKDTMDEPVEDPGDANMCYAAGL
jgi:hypothetical protein